MLAGREVDQDGAEVAAERGNHALARRLPVDGQPPLRVMPLARVDVRSLSWHALHRVPRPARRPEGRQTLESDVAEEVKVHAVAHGWWRRKVLIQPARRAEGEAHCPV